METQKYLFTLTAMAALMATLCGCSAGENEPIVIPTDDAPASTASDYVVTINRSADDTDEPVVMQTGEAAEDESEADDEAAESKNGTDSNATNATTASTPQKSESSKYTVTTVTSAAADEIPVATARTDLPQVTATEPTTVNPAETIATTAALTPETVTETDSNGFPANPTGGQIYYDEDGTRWIYVDIVGVGWMVGGDTIIEEFPHNHGDYSEGTQILF